MSPQLLKGLKFGSLGICAIVGIVYYYLQYEGPRSMRRLVDPVAYGGNYDLAQKLLPSFVGSRRILNWCDPSPSDRDFRHKETFLSLVAGGTMGPDFLRQLLDAGADVNKTCRGDSPLSSAAGGSKDEAIQLLLDRGADIRYADDMGRTALHNAAANTNMPSDRIAILVKAGADINAIDKNGRTPVMYSIGGQWGREYIIETSKRSEILYMHSSIPGRNVTALLDLGVKLDQIDNNGDTALTMALRVPCKYHNLALIEELWKRGARLPPNLSSTQLESALSQAGHNCPSISAFLKKM